MSSAVVLTALQRHSSVLTSRCPAGSLHCGFWHLCCFPPAVCLLGVTRGCWLMWRFEYINNFWDKSRGKFEITLGLTLVLSGMGVLTKAPVCLSQVKTKVMGSAGEIIKSFNIVVEISLIFWILVSTFNYQRKKKSWDFINYNIECIKDRWSIPASQGQFWRWCHLWSLCIQRLLKTIRTEKAICSLISWSSHLSSIYSWVFGNMKSSWKYKNLCFV